MKKNGQIPISGVSAEILQKKDWSQTSLGICGSWPGELFSYINIMLGSPLAMCLIWGEEQIHIYNDAFRLQFSSLLIENYFGDSLKHSSPELYKILSSAAAKAMQGKTAVLEQVVFTENLPSQEFKFNFTPLYSDNKVSGVMFNAEKTQMKSGIFPAPSEDRLLFQTLSDASPILTATCQPDGAADYFSASWLALTGWKKEDLLGYGWIGIIHPNDKDAFLETYKKAVEKKQEWKGIFRVKSIKGTYHLLSAAGTPLYNHDNSFLGYISSSVDITEQHRLLSSLQESEQKLKAMVQKGPIGICLLDAETLVCEVVNDSFLEVAGKPYESIAGRYYWDSFAEARPYYEQALAGVVQKGESYYANEVELMLIRHGQEESVYVTFVYTPLKDTDGKVQKVAVWVLDNTLQVKEREKVAQSEREIRALIDSAPFPIGVYKGREMRIAMANNAIIDIYGKGPDVIGKLYTEILPELDNQEVFKQLDRVYSTGEPYHVDNQRLDILSDNKIQTYYFNYSFTPLFDSEGKVYGIMNTGADVTQVNLAQRKIQENEQNLRNTILQAPAAMCIFRGPEHVVEIANRRMLEFWSKTEEEVLNKPIFEGLPEARSQGFEEMLKKVYNSGESIDAEAVPVTLLRGGEPSLVYVNFTYQAFRETDGTISGILAVAVDVTAQVLAQQKIEEKVQKRTMELAESNENLERTNRELAQFAYIASHDLQEPLRKISVFAQMLDNAADNKLQGRAADYLSKIRISAARMTALVRDVLAYSELGKSDDALQKTDLHELLKGILNDYELLIEQKKAEIDLNNLPVIEAIPLQMNQLFANLINNALKYAVADKRPHIVISASKADKDEIHAAKLSPEISYVKIQVKDNGIGIAPEHHEQIFSIFKRLHRKSEFEGTGIGLAICRKIVQNHGGEINAYGSSSQGAVFNIYLPQ